MSESTPKPNEMLRDPDAVSERNALIDDFRFRLEAEAAKIARGDRITPEDIHAAASRLNRSHSQSRPFSEAQEVISAAIRENRYYEIAAGGMALTLFVVGLLLLAGRFGSGSTGLVGGTIIELLSLAPIRMFVNARRQNIALRMLGLVVDRADDREAFGPLMRDIFLAVIVGTPQFTVKDEL